MTIEERAEKWALEWFYNPENAGAEMRDALAEAYLAGSAQTQADYNAPDPNTGRRCEKHGEMGCAWCIQGPYDTPSEWT